MDFKAHGQSRYVLPAWLPTKTMRIMKLTASLFLVACLQVSAAGYSQNITLSVKNMPLEKVFAEIQRQTGYNFIYSKTVLQTAKAVDLSVSDASLEEVMKICLNDQPLTYTLMDRYVIIKSKQKEKEEAPPPPGEIKGRVTNAQGAPLAGANIIFKRTKRGTQTNVKGEFTLSNVNPDDILIVSFIGYKTQTVKVGGGKEFPIVMQVTTNELDKVVVQAYGTTSQRLTTGDIGTVSAAQIERQPVMNVLTALQGQVPGLVITQVNGYASAPFKVEIRGRSGIDPSRPSEPLYIIDGVPLTILESGFGGNYAEGSSGITQNGFTGPAGGQSPLFSINPNDIESISVLKDADATAIYGSRGANGVILITTKKGKPGKTKLDVTAYQGVSLVTNHYSMLNTKQYLMARNEAFKNDGIIPNTGNAYDLTTWDTTRYTNWQNYLWGNLGHTTDIEAALSGGDKQTTFRVAGGYHRETDITEARGANQRASIQFNLLHKSINDRLTLSFISTYSYVYLNIIQLPGNVVAPPNAPSAFNSAGQLNWTAWYPSSNPFGPLLQEFNSNTLFLNTALTIQYEILKGLSISTKLGYSTSHNSELFKYPIVSQDPISNPTGSAEFGNNNNQNAIVEPNLEYNRLIGRGKLNILAGASVQSVEQDGNTINGSGYLNDHLLSSIDNAPSTSASDNNDFYKYAAVFGRINYNWQDKYILNLSARRDGSSRFGPGKQYGNFGSIGVAWIFTEEDWFKNHIPFLSLGKFRGSYGLTGSDQIGDYGYLSRWASITTSTYISGLPAYLPQGFFNPNLEWQVNKKLEGAIDLGFFKDRLSLEAALYQNRCGNQLVQTPLPYLSGFNGVTENLPATVQNTGIEMTVEGKLVDEKDFELIARFNIGINRNKLIAFPNLSQSPYASSYTVGQPLNRVDLLHYTGIDPQTGQYTFLDKNHDGQIIIDRTDSANDLSFKDLSVKCEGGFGIDLRYKSFQLSAFFRFRQWTEPGDIAVIGFPGSPNNEPTEVLNRWQKPGDKSQFARFTTEPQASDENFYYYSDGVYSNASYLRLQNLALTYDLKVKSINSCKLYLRGENLFLITKYKGLDPDVPVFGGMPPAKVFVGGLLFNF
jgi:TonB-linked SusC/RagA family outer membrane protein